MTLAKCEYITGLTGAYRGGGVGSYNQVENITIETNIDKYGPFGGFYYSEFPKNYFSCTFGPNNHFGGFHGSFANGKLESIGVYVVPTSKPMLT